MARRLFTVAAVISLALCVASVLLCLTTYRDNSGWNEVQGVQLSWSSASSVQFSTTKMAGIKLHHTRGYRPEPSLANNHYYLAKAENLQLNVGSGVASLLRARHRLL